MELIKIIEENEKRAVSARELHLFLETETRFDVWIKRMLEYGFVENVDFQCLVKNVQMPNGGFKEALDDYALTISCAKEIAMIQRSEKGKAARLYFIEVEKRYKSQAPQSFVEALRAYADEIEKRELAEKQVLKLSEKNEDLEIALNESLQYYTVAKYNKTFKMKWSLKECQRIGKMLSAYCRVRGIEIRKCETNDERFGSTNSYNLLVWSEFLNKHKLNN